MKSIIELEQERFEWALKTFPEATSLSSLKKLSDEVREIKIELELVIPFNKKQTTTEYADALMCLFDSAGRAGITPENIFEAFAEKFEINKKRDWVKNENNTYSHIKQ
jgi:chromosomal replication initiation ATPase DnaA